MDAQIWNSPWSILPDFEEWLNHFKPIKENLEAKTFFGLDSQEYGPIQVNRTVFDLRNGGIVRVTDRYFKRTSHQEVRINYAELVVGLEPAIHRDDFVKLTQKEHIERDLTPEEMEVYNPILKDKKKKRTKEEEDALIRTVKEEKIHEDVVYTPGPHSLLWVSFRNLSRILVENERFADYDKIEASQCKLDRPLSEIFGAQAGSYTHKAVTTISLPNGVVIKILPGGDVLMKNFEKGSTKEEYRLITDTGTTILFHQDGRKEVMLANGNMIKFENRVWTSTNNKGLRKKTDLSTGEEEEISPVPTVVKSNSVLVRYPILCSREDGVKIIIYENGDRYTNFKDGTQVLNSERKHMLIIESPGLPPVRIFKGRNQDDTYRRISPVVDRIVKKAQQKRYIEIDLPDQSKGYTYIDRQTGESQFILETLEGGIFKSDSEGKSVLIPAECRWSFKNIFDNQLRLQEKRSILVSRVEEIETNVNNMQEAIMGMSKAQPKGKKFTKKQLREEKDKEEKKIAEYQAQMIADLATAINQVDIQNQEFSSTGFSEYLNQLELPVEQRACGVFSFDINESSFSLK